MPETCDAIRDDLNNLISAYWESEPTTDVNFLVEADRFCSFLERQPGLSDVARTSLQKEHAVLAAKLAGSRAIAAGYRPATTET